MDIRFQFPAPLSSEPVQPPMVFVKQKAAWEYKQILRNLRQEQAPDEQELNALGADGWELSGVFSDLPFLYLYFKRQKP